MSVAEKEDWQEVDSKFEAHPYKRWNQSGLGKITDFQNVPDDWDWTDYDIDEDDVEANIQRCKDRIEDGIMPQWWEDRLEYLEGYFEKVKEKIAREPDGLSLDVISRLINLELIKDSLGKHGDDYNQLMTIHEIMKSYRDGSLTWKHGHVTYWSNGTLISDSLEEFDWDRFRKLSDIHLEKYKSEKDPNPKTGIWVEGGVNSGPDLRKVNWPRPPRIQYDPSQSFGRHHRYNLAFRVPGAINFVRMSFLDDTGCSRSVIYPDDLERIVNIANLRRPRFLNYIVNETADGHTVDAVLELECCLCAGARDFLTPWVSTEVSVNQTPRQVGQMRLAGSFLREMVYTATVPDGRSILFISKTKSALTTNPEFPAVDINYSTCAVSMPAEAGVAPPRAWRNLVRSTNLLP